MITTQYRIMAKRVLTISIVLILFSVTIAGAQEPSATTIPQLPAQLYTYTVSNLPAHFNTADVLETDNTPTDNPITDAGATLGRVLFYDTRLSANNTISCASCHLQSRAFTDPDQFSTGFEGGLTGRNAMDLANARYFEPGTFFWDERAATLEDQVLMPIQDSVEMGLTLEEMVTKLEAETFYPPLFEAAFGTSDITSDRVSKAMAQFIRSMVSYQSKYDEGVATDFDNFTREERRGRNIFFGRGRCDECHATDLQIAPDSRNNGLDLVFADNGLGDVTGDPDDNGKFKVPSLRNVALTGPYMHDGRFNTLEEVIDFYNEGIQDHPNLDNVLREGGPNGEPRRFDFDEEDRAELVAFLETLTDEAFITDPRFSDPFITVFTSPLTVYLPVVIR
ncbi:MAG: cytochrome c peroxidase [Chloroflexota bacterium]